MNFFGLEAHGTPVVASKSGNHLDAAWNSVEERDIIVGVDIDKSAVQRFSSD